MTAGTWDRGLPAVPAHMRRASLSLATRPASGPGRRRTVLPPAHPAGSRLRFSPDVDRVVRVRAASGGAEPQCEACGVRLHDGGGLIRRVVRDATDRRLAWVLASAANGVLLCGTGTSGCCGRAAACNGSLGARGFWAPYGTDPRLIPMLLHPAIQLWRSVDGRYLGEPPGDLHTERSQSRPR